MKNTLNFLLANTLPYWVSASFPIIRIVLVAIIGVCAIGLIITTLLQSNDNKDATSALSGASQESYYAQNKGESKNVKLSRATIVFASIIAVCIVLYFVSLLVYNPVA